MIIFSPLRRKNFKGHMAPLVLVLLGLLLLTFENGHSESSLSRNVLHAPDDGLTVVIGS